MIWYRFLKSLCLICALASRLLINRIIIVKIANLKNLKLNLIKYDVEKMIDLHRNLYDEKSFFQKTKRTKRKKNDFWCNDHKIIIDDIEIDFWCLNDIDELNIAMQLKSFIVWLIECFTKIKYCVAIKCYKIIKYCHWQR